MSEDKDKPHEATGYLELEGLKLVRENSKKSDPADGNNSFLFTFIIFFFFLICRKH